MSREKIQKVLDFPTPQTVRTLRSFLGQVNYFKDHIPNSATYMKPPHDLLAEGVRGVSKRQAMTANDDDLGYYCSTLQFRLPTMIYFRYLRRYPCWLAHI